MPVVHTTELEDAVCYSIVDPDVDTKDMCVGCLADIDGPVGVRMCLAITHRMYAQQSDCYGSIWFREAIKEKP